MDLPHDLHDALEAVTAEFPVRDLAAAVERLIARYRRPGRADQPILLSAVDVAGYAAYRMPATWAAVRAALDQFAGRMPGFAPGSLLDVGGGTGAAAWAAADAFPSLAEITVVDQVAEALELGRGLAARAGSAALRGAAWQRRRLQDQADFPAADLVTVSYVLSELSEAEQAELVRRAAGAALGAVAVVEPGTPDGYARIMAARDVLRDAGWSIAAPCPHQADCPLAETPGDWCHFAARVNRSPLHRRLKEADLGHEDEKFAYVVGVRGEVPAGRGRILRHPQKRKGLVMMQICTPADGVRPVLVSKKQGPAYRDARDAEWGDPWPAAEPEA